MCGYVYWFVHYVVVVVVVCVSAMRNWRRKKKKRCEFETNEEGIFTVTSLQDCDPLPGRSGNERDVDDTSLEDDFVHTTDMMCAVV